MAQLEIKNITTESLPGILSAIDSVFMRKGDVSAISINDNPAAEIYFKDDGTLDYYVTADGETHETSEDLKSYIAEKIAEAQLGGEGGNVDLSIYAKKREIESALEGKVNKEEGKALSSNDFTDELKEKLENLDLTNVDPDNVVIYTGNDAARALLGGSWRIPSKTDWEELWNYTTHQSTTINGIGGYKYISKTDSSKYIFIPNVYCWTSSPYGNNVYYRTYSGTYASSAKYYGYYIHPVSNDEGVDLGLPSGLRWATCNLGATSEEQLGNQYAWGETEPKTSFTLKNYKYTQYSGGSSTYSSSNNTSSYPTSINLGERLEGKIILGDSLEIVGFQKKDGTVISLNLPKRELKDIAYTGNYSDLYGTPNIPSYYNTLGKTKNEFTSILTGQPGDDAARVVLGGLWKTPSCDDWAELYNNTTREETTVGGVIGCKFKSKTNNSYIFIPGNSGCYDGSTRINDTSSYFWTSEAWNGGDNDSNLVNGKAYGWNSMTAHYVYLTAGTSQGTGISLESIYHPNMSRYCGLNIRSVTQEAGKGVDLGLPSGLRWASCNLGATSEEQYGNYYAWGEVETKTSYTQNNYKYYISSDSEANTYRPWYSKYNALDGYRFLQLEEAVPTRMYYNMQGKLVKMIDLYGKEYNVSSTSDNPGTGGGGGSDSENSFLSNDEINDLVNNIFN